MRSNTCRKGEMAKSKVVYRAYEKGIVVSVPTIDADYDLILDIEGSLVRAQVKWSDSSSTRASGSLMLTLRRTTRNNKQLVYDKEAVDVLLVYVPKIDKVLWLPPDVWHGRSSLTIRYKEARNNQKSGTLMAQDYIW